MRADRLISILMLLQARGKMTAGELAKELDVSERTIYRDVEALCISGVPLYAEHGPGGGLALLDSYRTNLTGMDEEELRALFMVFSLPGPLEPLGANLKLKSAMLKLSAALPGARRSDEEKVRQRFFLDWSWWFHSQEPVPHLTTIQMAVWEDRKLCIKYRAFQLMPFEDEVDPYALVAKAGIWYMIAGVEKKPHVYRISWLLDAQMLDESFERPVEFQLTEFWQDWCREYESQHQAFLVKLRMSPAMVELLPLYFGHPVLQDVSLAQAEEAGGWSTMTLPFESFESARDRLLGFGSAVEVLEPEALRCSMVDFAKQICAFYAERKTGNDQAAG